MRELDLGRYIDENDFDGYLASIVHSWLVTLTALGFTLIPVFFVLDLFIMPHELLPRFAFYRGLSTALVLVQYLIIRRTEASMWSYLHGYFVTLNVGGIIALMTVDLGGFSASYYAGLSLVVIGVNLLLPWRAIHSALNGILVVGLYVGLNLTFGGKPNVADMANNLFFLCSTALVAVSINHVKYKLVRKEFSLLVEVKRARDALWGEMEVAKRIQTALLPSEPRIEGFEVAATMVPAAEVGGDYYDIVQTPGGRRFVSMGDVSGHGVDSGLIMMMAQTSLLTMVNNCDVCTPSGMLVAVNKVIRDNISRLGSEHYMTAMVAQIEDDHLVVAGKHQDVIIYRAAANRKEVVESQGTWLGITDAIGPHLHDSTIPLAPGDIALFFTDGITEAASPSGEMFGQAKLEEALVRYADLPPRRIIERILEEVRAHETEQADDMTLIVLKKTSRG